MLVDDWNVMLFLHVNIVLSNSNSLTLSGIRNFKHKSLHKSKHYDCSIMIVLSMAEYAVLPERYWGSPMSLVDFEKWQCPLIVAIF